MQRGSGYFFTLNVVLLLLVLSGFAPTFYLTPATVRETFPAHLILHGAVLTLWFLWAAGQVSLVRLGRPDLHRITGTVGVLIGAVAVYAGPVATVGAIAPLRARGLEWTSNMSAYPALGIESMNLDQYSRALVWGNFASALCFALLLAGAVYWRRRPDVHKRLITLASIAYIPPALARISRWPYLGGEDGVVVPLFFIALLLSMMIHDRRTGGRVHRATWAGIALIAVLNIVALIVAATPGGQAFVRSLALVGQLLPVA